MKPSHFFVQLFLVAALPLAVSAAPACGSTVSGKVVLDADMNCVETSALKVGGDNTTVDLNGHTIACTGAGYQNSCLDSAGISSEYFNNVTIKGPGKITNFAKGVSFRGGMGTVRDLDISGPKSPGLGFNPRDRGTGILVEDLYCGQASDPINVFLINNTISNLLTGIRLNYGVCTSVTHNSIHDLNSDVANATGIYLYNTQWDTLDSNRIEAVGGNRSTGEAGILFYYAGASEVTNNVVSNNCGDGIQLGYMARSVSVKKNIARNNGTTSLNGQCQPPSPGFFADLASRNAGDYNVLNKNNECQTQLGPIPAGVCKPND